MKLYINCIKNFVIYLIIKGWKYTDSVMFVMDLSRLDF